LRRNAVESLKIYAIAVFIDYNAIKNIANNRALTGTTLAASLTASLLI
jgi:hypothetical protein